MRTPLVLIGALHLAAGLFMALSPRGFYEALGTFPPYNAHFLRDLATWYVAFGVLLLLAERRPAWQVPLLTLAVAQTALHAVNHVIDVGLPVPSWKGPASAGALAILALVLWALLRTASRR